MNHTNVILYILRTFKKNLITKTCLHITSKRQWTQVASRLSASQPLFEFLTFMHMTSDHAVNAINNMFTLVHQTLSACMYHFIYPWSEFDEICTRHPTTPSQIHPSFQCTSLPWPQNSTKAVKMGESHSLFPRSVPQQLCPTQWDSSCCHLHKKTQTDEKHGQQF